jgi:hypothetical protein
MVPNPMMPIMIAVVYSVLTGMVIGEPDFSRQLFDDGGADDFDDSFYGFSPPDPDDDLMVEEQAGPQEQLSLGERAWQIVITPFVKVAEVVLAVPKLIISVQIAMWNFAWAVGLWFWDIATLNVPGAPVWARTITATYFLGTALLTMLWVAERISNILGPLIPFTMALPNAAPISQLRRIPNKRLWASWRIWSLGAAGLGLGLSLYENGIVPGILSIVLIWAGVFLGYWLELRHQKKIIAENEV